MNKNNINEVMERFEIVDCTYDNSPIIILKRFLKNSDNKSYSYLTFIEKNLFNISKNELLEKYNDADNDFLLEEMAIFNAYHKQYGNGLKDNEIYSLNNSDNIIEEDKNLLWIILGYYTKTSKKIKRLKKALINKD